MSTGKRICVVAVAGFGRLVLANALSNDHAIASWPYQFGAWVAHLTDWKCRLTWTRDQHGKKPDPLVPYPQRCIRLSSWGVY